MGRVCVAPGAPVPAGSSPRAVSCRKRWDLAAWGSPLNLIAPVNRERCLQRPPGGDEVGAETLVPGVPNSMGTREVWKMRSLDRKQLLLGVGPREGKDLSCGLRGSVGFSQLPGVMGVKASGVT